ncbi:MAG: hypothetical protein ACFNL4_04260, partial [Corynebacterium matruchotii]
ERDSLCTLLEPLDSFDAVRGGRPVARLDPVKRSYPLAVSTWFRKAEGCCGGAARIGECPRTVLV